MSRTTHHQAAALPDTGDSPHASAGECRCGGPALETAAEAQRSSCTALAGGPHSAASETRVRRSATRWWAAVAVGSIVSLPLAWLLSYGAALPFFLGLFFFVLFGLVIGAVMHRLAASGRPYRRWPLLAGTTFVVTLVSGITIVKEAADFPADMADDSITKTLNLGTRTPGEYRDAVTGEVRGFLAERYAPGGTLGYVRWILKSGVVAQTDAPTLSRSMRRSPHGTWWAIRVVLSVALLGFGIGSQTLVLKLPRDPSHRKIDAER